MIKFFKELIRQLKCKHEYLYVGIVKRTRHIHDPNFVFVIGTVIVTEEHHKCKKCNKSKYIFKEATHIANE